MGSVIGKGVCVCVKYLNHVCVFLIDYDDEEEYDEDEYYDDEDDEGNDPTLTVFHKANMKRRTRLDSIINGIAFLFQITTMKKRIFWERSNT